MNEDCKEWEGPLNHYGYGIVYWGKRRRGAHRVIYEIVNGPIPEGLNVLHKCDNPTCVNPEHLFLGTQADNIQDCVVKGRHRYSLETARRRGEDHHKSKLTWEIVDEIRKGVKTGKQEKYYADKYSVSDSTISLVVQNKGWYDPNYEGVRLYKKH